MKAAFKEGVRVRFKLRDGSLGALAQITEPKEGRFGQIERGYMGEGFYHVTTIPDQRNLIAHEDDLVLDKERVTCNHDPKEMTGKPIGMYHCPECGEMVIAGMEHPDYSLLDEEAEALAMKQEHIDTGPHEGCTCKYCNCTPESPCLDTEYCPHCKTFPSGSGG